LNFWIRNPVLFAEEFIKDMRLGGAEVKQQQNKEKQRAKDKKKNKD